MRRALPAVLAIAMLVAVATPAGAAKPRLFVNGDSLADGTRPYIPRVLRGWRVRQSTKVSRHAHEGDDVLRRRGRRLERVIHVSLGTNDDPGQPAAFRTAIRDVMDVAGERRCVVWANIVRPAYGGVSYRRLNRVLAAESEARENLLVVNWVRMMRRHPEWLAPDGVHASAEGYRARARAVGRAARRCPA